MKLWICDLSHTQQILNSDVMPAQIGSIAAYTYQQLGIRARLFKYPEKLAAALTDDMPAVIGFTNYIWNFRLSYAFAERIKQLSPATVIIFGGPNFPIDIIRKWEFLEAHPCIDYYVEHEGELAFVRLLVALVESEEDSRPRIWNADHRADLAALPSPYLTGFMDEFFDGKLIPILQTNRGCPFTCSFCVEGMSYYTKVHRHPIEKVEAEIEYIARRVSVGGFRRDLYIADSNFGMYREDIGTCQALGRSMERFGWPSYINCTTGKNAKERVLDAARLLKGALRLSGSVQSLDREVLANVKRSNIREDEILDLALKSAEIGANSYSEIILGLPGDSKEKHMASLKTIVDAGFQNVYTWQLMLLSGSELDTTAERQKFGIKTRFRVLPRCFGQFAVRGEPVVAAEIEEVCVESSTMRFEDYLDCRKLHLVIAIFYNDSLMVPFLKILRNYRHSVFGWLLELAKDEHPLFAQFERDTQLELHNDRDQLAKISSYSIPQFIAGEQGNNLIFTYRTRAIRQYLWDMVHLGAEALRKLLPDDHPVIQDAAKYILHRTQGLFDEPDHVRLGYFNYDWPGLEHEQRPATLECYRFQCGRVYEFHPSPWLSEQLALYGNSEVGIGRILMKAHVSKLYRTPAHSRVAQ